MKSIIVGIDPGVTYGIAILDTDGRLVHLSSKKHASKSYVIRLISRFGHPIIIATDVNPCPKTVENLTRNYGCKLWYPKRSLSLVEKLELVREFKENVGNPHERDALAAAVKSYRAHSTLLKRIQNAVKRACVEEKYDEVVWKVVVEGKKSICDAINEFRRKKVEKRVRKRKRYVSVEEYKRAVEKLTQRIRKLEKALQSARERLETKRRVMEVKPPRRLVNKVERLSSELKERELLLRISKRIREIEQKNLVPVVNIDKFSVEVFDRFVGLKGIVVFTNDPSNLVKLDGHGIKAVLTKGSLKTELDLDYPIIDARKFNLSSIKYVASLNKSLLEDEIKKAKKGMFVEWLKKYKKRKL